MKTHNFSYFMALAFACTAHFLNAATNYVWQNSPSPTPPYDSWATAAHVIQDAVDASVDGDTVLVTNGVYSTGGRAIHGTMTNRVAIDRAITLLGVNGPEVTVIEGGAAPGGNAYGNGDGAVRGVYVGANAFLSGFTVTNGHTLTDGYFFEEMCGGGVHCDDAGVVLDSVIRGNRAHEYGGGAMGGTLQGCQLEENIANDGDDYGDGGGAFNSVLRHCLLAGNSVGNEGGGAQGGYLYGCLLTGNSAGFCGGAVSYAVLFNCTVVRNSATSHSGGADHCTLYNSIVYLNEAPRNPNYNATVQLDFCLTTPLPTAGLRNIDADPAFRNPDAGNYRLAPGSPCIDAGSDFHVGGLTNLSDIIDIDLAGNSRPLDGDGDGFAQFDIGAYEYGMLTPSEAIEELILALDDSSLDDRRKHPLQASLLAALASIDRDQVFAAVNQLEAFQKKVRAQITRIDAPLAEDLIGAAQEIIDALTAPEPEPQPEPQPVPMPNMVWIEAGTFMMGSPTNEASRYYDEAQHEVIITRGFWMGKYEVTQAEYLEVMGSNPSHFRNGTPPYGSGTGGQVTNELLHPVDDVTWMSATHYCSVLTERERAAGRLPEGWVYRLPTQAEWEYACRAGTTSAFHYGNELRSGMENFDAREEYDATIGTILNSGGSYLGRTTEVGSYTPNAWGLYDMHGNVCEWCQDWYGSSAIESRIDPTGPADGSHRVYRGGSWFDSGRYCRSAFIGLLSPEYSDLYSGFRVVLGHPYPLE